MLLKRWKIVAVIKKISNFKAKVSLASYQFTFMQFFMFHIRFSSLANLTKRKNSCKCRQHVRRRWRENTRAKCNTIDDISHWCEEATAAIQKWISGSAIILSNFHDTFLSYPLMLSGEFYPAGWPNRIGMPWVANSNSSSHRSCTNSHVPASEKYGRYLIRISRNSNFSVRQCSVQEARNKFVSIAIKDLWLL